MTLAAKERSKINVNTFEITIETMLELHKWPEALQLVRVMDKIGYKPTIGVLVELVEQLEKAREYKAVLALYHLMEQRGYDFYENMVIDSVFKRLIKVASAGLGNLHVKDQLGSSPLETYFESIESSSAESNAVKDGNIMFNTTNSVLLNDSALPSSVTTATTGGNSLKLRAAS